VLLLAALVDECCDPTGCEYAIARMGGMVILETTTFKWPLDKGDRDAHTGLEGATLSQQWQGELGEGSGLKWKSLETAATRLLRSARPRRAAKAGENRQPQDHPAG
jgi:hypothetical protein